MAGCIHWLLRFELISHFIVHTFLQTPVRGSSTIAPIQTDCSTEDLFDLFNTTQMYRTNPRPFWLLSQDPLQSKPHKITKWVIHENEIWASHGWSRRNFREVGSYKLYCENSRRQEGKFDHQIIFMFSNDSDADGSEKYVCVGLVLRGPLIFQVRLSEVKEYHSTPSHGQVCTEHNMADVGITFVNFEDSSTGWNEYVESFAQFVQCPISGGYAITSWMDETGQTKCKDPYTTNLPGKGSETKHTVGNRHWHLRVEDECDHGTGLVFSEEKDDSDCKNPFFGEIYQNDALRCFASWFDMDYNYAIALTDFPNSAYCIRVPHESTGEVQVYVFKDGICDLTSYILNSKEYVRMHLVQYPQSFAYDGISPSYTILSQNVPSDLQGNWYRETEALGDDHIHIAEHTINSTQLGIWEFVGPASCSIETHGLQDKGAFYFVTSTKQNGCRPRLALIWLMSFSKSVLGFQLSQSAIINHDVSNKTAGSPLANLCHDLHFGESNQILKDKYHIEPYAWYNLVNTDETIPLVDCSLGGLSQMKVTLSEGESCTVGIKQNGANAFSVTINSCNHPVKGITVRKPIEHQCMARYKGKNGWSSYLITRTPQHQTNLAKRQFVCWLFSNEEPRGLIMPIGDCNDETMVQVSEMNSKVALVKFYLVKETVTKGAKLVSSMLVLVSVLVLSLSLVE